MELRRTVLVGGGIALGIVVLVALGVASARILGDRAYLRASLEGIEARLRRIEESLPAAPGNLPPPPAAIRQTDALAAPTLPEAERSQPEEPPEWNAALADITARLDEIQKVLENSAAREPTERILWAGVEAAAEKPPEDLSVRLDVHVVHETEGLRVKVYWRLTGGHAGATDRDWIGLYPVEAKNTEYVRWQYTKGLPSGEMSLELPVKPGWYEARYLFKSGYEAVPSSSAPVAITPTLEAAANENASPGED